MPDTVDTHTDHHTMTAHTTAAHMPDQLIMIAHTTADTHHHIIAAHMPDLLIMTHYH